MTAVQDFEESLKQLARNPDVALIPFVFDALALALVLVLVVSVGGDPTFGPGELVRSNFPADLPEGMPTVAYVGDPAGVLFDPAPAHLAGFAIAVLATVPVRAYGLAGFVGVLYHRVHKGLGPQAQSFFRYANRFIGPMMVLELLFVVLFLPALYIWLVAPVWAVAYVATVAFASMFLVFAPYAVVADGVSLGVAVRRSARAFVEHPLPCLGTVVAALLVTGSFAYVARWLIAAYGVVGYLAAGLVFSPIGAVLALLFLSVYTVLRGSPYVADPGRVEAGAML